MKTEPVALKELFATLDSKLKQPEDQDGFEVNIADDLPLVVGDQELLVGLMYSWRAWYPLDADRDDFFHTIKVSLFPDETAVLIRVHTARRPDREVEMGYSGLELDIARMTVEYYGGQIEVTRTSDEAMVEFTLPVWPP